MKYIRCIYLGLLFFIYESINQIVRVILLIHVGTSAIDSFYSIPLIFSVGFINDVFPFILITLPLATWVLLTGSRVVGKITQQILFVIFSLYTAVFLFTGAAEYLFWDELHCRFNFIAIDYLIYTTEVVKNIIESYPVAPILIGILLCSLSLSWILLRPIAKKLNNIPVPSVRWFFNVWIILASITIIYSPSTFSNNALSQELSKNGIWSLFSAFRNNQLDYRQFYPVIDKKLAFELLHNELIEPNSVFFNDNSMEWRRYIHSNSPEKHLNVITIVVESLGSVSLGDRTPHLNDLSKKCLYFTNMKATGTRTVRGLEAIILSLPPTPGASIVRRPNNHNLFNTGTLFRQRGYDTVFIYGGYGYFDNMNEFFSGNGFRIIDRSTIPDEYKTFTNAWGICDEDLFDAVIREADIAYTSNKPFYHVALTTSNHRPFTYPDGRVDVPSGTSRTGAIKYTDYAIHRFLKEAKKKPWFSDTIFIIVADHTAGSAGKTVLPPDNYDIPCFIYSPAHIKSQKIDTLCCQLDIAPTLFSLLNWNYSSSFFGKNILTLSKNDGRAWIGTYQLLGYLTEKELVILEPLKNPIIESFLSSYTTATNKSNSILIQQAIAVYQTAQELFTQGKLKENMLSTPDEIILSTSQ